MSNKTTIKLWLDDLRTPPEGWTCAKTVDEAIALFEEHVVSDISLDNDLGTDAEGTPLPEGRHLALWMAENECWPTNTISVHSANPIGVQYMIGVITRYGPFVREGRTTKFVHE
jgi:hypothetical protein